jgi:hypothetical protein
MQNGKVVETLSFKSSSFWAWSDKKKPQATRKKEASACGTTLRQILLCFIFPDENPSQPSQRSMRSN